MSRQPAAEPLPPPGAGETAPEPAPDGGPPMSRAAVVKLLVLGAVLLGVGVLVAVAGGAVWGDVSAWVDSLGWWGPLVFALCYALAVTALVPGSVLNASAGALFGVAVGVGSVLVGATAGAAISFALARALGRPAVARYAGSGRLARLDAYLSRRAFESVLVLRMVGLFPFGVVNYGAGVAGVRFGPYIAGTFAGIIPGTLVYTGLGKALREPGSPMVWIAPVGLVLLSGFSWWLSRFVRARGERAEAAAVPAPAAADD
ncbi:TVP38/TMEM64 family protein [Actinomadura violacea]|uniref:TVP38/TMEM64 family membrane protein n=1 Tax=Actinomadura violacea TaxID=2819934 RepID=A0ABS3RPA9_9ACTN|nr:TVP38/TMEM64 family protein [Actinomadura violacea]MBO2457900.1 TVP38/TMEM64 family protein [Actinomadura violacea]